MKNEKGITLIALVITIIVLLILAGISIAMLTGDNGLLTKSKQSAAASAVAGAKDEISLEFQKQMADYLKDKYTAGATTVTPSAQTILNKFANVSSGDAAEATVNGCKVTKNLTQIVVKYPATADSTENADYFSVGNIDSSTIALSWSDNGALDSAQAQNP